MRSAMITLVTVYLLLAGAVSVHAQRTFTGSLDGLVTTVEGAQPAGTIRVRLEKFGMTIQERFTSEGRFQFGGLADGSYTIIIESPDYEKSTTAVEVPGESFFLIKVTPTKRANTGRVETRSVLTYLFEANRMAEAEELGLKLHRSDKHGPDVHLVLVKIYLRQGKQPEILRELEFFVNEAPPGRLRDEARKILAVANAR